MKYLLIITLLASANAFGQARQSFLEWRYNICENRTFEYGIAVNGEVLFNMQLKSDTLDIMPSMADSLFKKAKVITVAGKLFMLMPPGFILYNSPADTSWCLPELEVIDRLKQSKNK